MLIAIAILVVSSQLLFFRSYCDNKLQNAQRRLVWQAWCVQSPLSGWNRHLHHDWSGPWQAKCHLVGNNCIHCHKSNLSCLQHPATVHVQVWRLSKRSKDAYTISVLIVKIYAVSQPQEYIGTCVVTVHNSQEVGAICTSPVHFWELAKRHYINVHLHTYLHTHCKTSLNPLTASVY